MWAYELEGHYYAECHLEVDGSLPLFRAHALASRLEELAKETIPRLAELTTHIEPKGELAEMLASGQEEAGIEEAIRQVVRDGFNRSCGQIQLRRGTAGWMVSIDCEFPGEMPLAEAHRISTWLEARLRGKIGGLDRVMIHTGPPEKRDENQ